MCGCDHGFVCSRCRDTPFAEAVESAEPVSLAEWDAMVAGEQAQTAEPFEGRVAPWR